MLAYLLRLRNRWAQVGLVVALLLSTVPAVKTSNRGMFIGLGIVVAYVLLRQLFARNWRAVAFGVGVAAVGVIGLFATGTVAEILGRQNYSDSTGGRAALYKSTWEATLQSPIVGYGTPRMEPSVGAPRATCGHSCSALALWAWACSLFSYQAQCSQVFGWALPPGTGFMLCRLAAL